MTDAMRTFRKYLQTHDRLIQEVQPALDPSTDRADDLSVWMMVASTQSDVLGLLSLSDCELTPHLEDLRRIIEALDRRISPIGG